MTPLSLFLNSAPSRTISAVDFENDCPYKKVACSSKLIKRLRGVKKNSPHEYTSGVLTPGVFATANFFVTCGPGRLLITNANNSINIYQIKIVSRHFHWHQEKLYVENLATLPL
jgi:hypothetical protein